MLCPDPLLVWQLGHLQVENVQTRAGHSAALLWGRSKENERVSQLSENVGVFLRDYVRDFQTEC